MNDSKYLSGQLVMDQVSLRFSKSGFGIDHLSFELERGLYILVGPNGAGKTTLLRLLAGLLPPQQGRIWWNGRSLEKQARFYRAKLGYLPQIFGVYEHMTGRDFLGYFARLKGLAAAMVVQRVNEVAELFSLESWLDRKVSAWSQPLRQRLGLAQALLNDPSVLILDEPYAGLDEQERMQIHGLLLRLAETRLVILSTHVFDALPIARILLLVAGNLEFIGAANLFCAKAQGAVWTGTMPKEDWLFWESVYGDTSLVRYYGEFCQYTIIGREKPPIEGIKAVDPSLEKAYFFWLQEIRCRERPRL
ncbi:MAG: ATP-binding cassette domain-containing protein [Sporomusaceae bacterium]|nr:ATP-binding cassette domain-containing protein [Sporomusaceae bacterium]